MRTSLLAFGVMAVGAGCTSTEAPVSRVELRQALGTPDAHATGVTVAPDGSRFVFDEDGGLFRIEGDTGTQVMQMAALPAPDKALTLPITDLVAVSPGVFAITAIGDGFVLDTNAHTLTQRFCYVPDGTPSGETHRTDALTYDAELDQFLAEPATYNAAGQFEYAEVAAYQRDRGTAVGWYSVGGSVTAGGMALIPQVGLVLGAGTQLELFDRTTSLSKHGADLSRFGIGAIDGLAVDAKAGTLLVLDGASDELVEVPLSEL